jgi:gas vesicle protein
MSNSNSPFDFEGAPDAGTEIPAATGLAVLLVGAALGLAAGLLIAPKAGRDLRADLLSRAGNWKTHAADLLTQGRENIVNAVESSRKNA